MKILPIIGGTIAIFGMAFVSHRLWQHADEIRDIDLPTGTLVFLAAASLVTAACGVLLALAWRRLIFYLGGKLPPRQSICIYGVSQIGKYVPGNIFHVVGRQALAQQAGVPALVAIKSAAWEIGLIAVVSGLFACLALPGYLNVPVTWGVAAFIIFSAAGFTLLNRKSRDLAIAAAFQLIFLLGMGAIFSGIVIFMGGGETPVVLIGAYVLSWLIGLVTPGAPAGLGVRELVLYTLLTNMTEPSMVATAVVLGRLVNVVGDILFFLASFVASRRPPFKQAA